jgi:hypothetical protein
MAMAAARFRPETCQEKPGHSTRKPGPWIELKRPEAIVTARRTGRERKSTAGNHQ